MEMYSYRFFQRRILGDIPIYNLHGHFHWAGDIGSLAPRDGDHKLSDTEDTEDTEETEERKYKNIFKPKQDLLSFMETFYLFLTFVTSNIIMFLLEITILNSSY